jgi:steroid delta-isomerase-like uncharacterized protein
MGGAMSDAVRVLERWATVLSARDAQGWAELCSADCVHEDVALGVVNRGPEEVRAFAQLLFDAVPDFDVKIQSSFGDDSSAVCEWEMSGTQSGDLPDLPASGRSFKVRGATLVALAASGQVERMTEFWDTATWLRQLGLLPTPSG